VGVGAGEAEISIYLQHLNAGFLTMKIFNLTLAVLFLLFAALQFNDEPDDIIFWVLVYSGVGIISAFAAFKRYNMWVIMLGLAVVVFELFRKFPTFAQWIGQGMPSIIGEMKATSPYIELAREYLGLLVCLLVLVYHYIRCSSLRRQEKPFVE
jgi:hypothetical protein